MSHQHDKQPAQHDEAAARVAQQSQSAEAGATVNNSTMQALFGSSERSGPLPHRAVMERAFGQSFSDVQARVGARRALDQIGAQAATSGSSVAFAHSSPDVETVAHELAHVVQQRRGLSTRPGLSHPQDAHEREAELMAAEVAATATAPATSPAPTASSAASASGGGGASSA